MTYLANIGRYGLMLLEMFKKPTKWGVMKKLILKEIDELIFSSLGIIIFISFFIGGVVTIQTALNLTSPFLPKSLIGFATRQSVILEFAPTFTSIIMVGKVGSYITSSIGSMRVTEQIDAEALEWERDNADLVEDGETGESSVDWWYNVTAEENNAHIEQAHRCWKCEGVQTAWAQG